MKSIAVASFLGLLETACGGNSAAPRAPATNGNTGTRDLTSGYSSCTSKSCPKLRSIQISNKQITKGVNEEFGNISFTASVSDNDANRKVKLFVDSTSLVSGLKASPSGSGFALSGKIGVASSYSIRVFVRDLESCMLQSKNSSNCESSDKSNSNYDILDSISIAIVSGANEQIASSISSLPSSCPKTTAAKPNVLPAVVGSIGVLGTVLDGTSSTGSVLAGAAGILAQTFGPKPQQQQVSVTNCR